MPLEIRELHIKASVGGEADRSSAPRATDKREEDHETIVSECVARVLEILRQKSER